MELKQVLYPKSFLVLDRLNRTFYGIETTDTTVLRWLAESLNRTFYGIETGTVFGSLLEINSLNRTFYGIETYLYCSNF